MKIVYGAGNRIGGNQQLFRFLSHCSDHQIKIAAHIKSSESLSHIDWTLDALYHNLTPKQPQELIQLFGHSGLPKINLKEAEILIQEIDEFGPDLIISDGEPIVAHIAQALNIRLWYCSPLHLLDGIDWQRGDLRYLSLLENTKKFLSKLPPAEKKLIYSPFGDLINAPKLRPGYEWIQPYTYLIDKKPESGKNIAVVQDKTRLSKLSKIFNCLSFDLTLFTCFSDRFSHLQIAPADDIELYKEALSKCNWYLSTGETSYIADAIYNSVKRVCIIPNLIDPESLLNAVMCKLYQLGDDLAQVELMDKYSVEEIEKSQNRKSAERYIDKVSTKKLDEKVKELCTLHLT
ncbi:MAG TPA: hypothetical protein VM577_10280 [Anaerovoracaceae bacterium]|nr:hypothetical protein [Anaerovoracaceae bacterium]